MSSTPLVLPRTFASRSRDRVVFGAWKPFVGRWVARDVQRRRRLTAVFAPRVPRAGVDEREGTLTGLLVARSGREGVLHFPRPAAWATGVDASTRMAGRVWWPLGGVSAGPATLRRRPDAAAQAAPVLDLRLGQHAYVLRKEGPVDARLLSRIPVLGHRGLGGGALENTLAAFEHAWWFGASAIEADVIAPYRRHGSGGRTALLDQLTVWHPRGTQETVRPRTIPSTAPTLGEFFDALHRFHLPLVYLDLKLDWLSPLMLERALARIVPRAVRHVRAHTGRVVTIAAPTAKIARALGGTTRVRSALHGQRDVGWTMEWTEIRRPRRVLGDVRRAPEALSLSLMRIEGSRKWPGLEWLFPDVSSEDAARIRRLPQPLVHWTANEDAHFLGALESAYHPDRLARPRALGTVGLMTDHPHRAARWLALGGRADP